MSARYGVLAALSIGFVASCASDHPKVEREGTGSATAEQSDKGPRRVAITRKLLEDNKITPQDLSELQLYLRGRIVLRREVSIGVREITKQHTLRVVEGHTYDEVTVESGTPGVEIAQQGIKVNFDPGQPDAGFVFDQANDDKFKFRPDQDPRDRANPEEYGGEEYQVVIGSGAYLEIDAENLKNFVTREKKLPGAILP